MIVYFSSSTEFTHRFVEKLGMPSNRIPMSIKDAKDFEITEEYVLIVPTYELEIVRGPKQGQRGYIPRQVAEFLNNPKNRVGLKAVIGAGNRNFYDEFAFSADEISNKTGVPILYRVELAGTEQDVEIVKEGLNKFWDQLK